MGTRSDSRRGLWGFRFGGGLYVTAVCLGALVGCGGTANDGARQTQGGTGGAGGDGGGGGAAGSGAHGGAGGAGGGNVGGSGGLDCSLVDCAAIECGPGMRSVQLPGQCCPSCEACGTVSCPNFACGPNETPVTLPGQCCPSSCEPTVDGGGPAFTCTPASHPDCRFLGTCPDNWNWRDVVRSYGTCDPPPVVATYLAACGQWHALVYGRLDGEERYFFDQWGNLAGYDNGPRGGPPTVCEEYDSSFLPLERPACDFEPNCGVPRDGDAGPPHCGDGVVNAGESCDRIPGNQTCSSATQGALNGGYLTCNADCTLNTSTCHH